MPQVSSTPGGGTLVTSEYGGGRDKLAYAAEVLNAFGEQRRQREEEEKRRALQKAQFALESVGKGGVDPNSAVVRGAIDNVRKYDPETADLLAANLDAAAQERQAQQQSAAAGQRWMQGVERAEQPLRQMASDPGMWRVPGFDAQVGAPISGAIGQQVAQRAQAQLPQVPRDVALQMPFPEREAARVWAEGRGFTFPAAPTPPDPYGSTYTAGTREHLAAVEGRLPPEVAEGVRINRGLEISAGQRETSRLQDESGVRSEQRLALDRQRQRLAEQRLGLDREKEARMASAESEGAVKLGDVAKWLAADTTLLAKEWEVGLAEVMPKDPKPTEKAEARAKYEATAGPKPEPLLKLQANRLSRAAVEDLRANGVENPTDSEVQGAVEKLQRAYLSLLAGDPKTGRAPMSRDEAVRFLLGDG